MTTALEGDEGSASRPGRSLPPGKSRYPLYRRQCGPQGRSGQVRKISPSTGIRSPDRPALSSVTILTELLGPHWVIESDLVSMCVCVCVCIQIYIYIYIYTHICVCVCMHVCVHSYPWPFNKHPNPALKYNQRTWQIIILSMTQHSYKCWFLINHYSFHYVTHIHIGLYQRSIHSSRIALVCHLISSLPSLTNHISAYVMLDPDLYAVRDYVIWNILMPCLFVLGAKAPPVCHGLLIHEVSRSHTTTHHNR